VVTNREFGSIIIAAGAFKARYYGLRARSAFRRVRPVFDGTVRAETYRMGPGNADR